MGSAVGMSLLEKETLVGKLILITPFSWLGGAVYNEKIAFKVFVSFVRIRERLFQILILNQNFHF